MAIWSVSFSRKEWAAKGFPVRILLILPPCISRAIAGICHPCFDVIVRVSASNACLESLWCNWYLCLTWLAVAFFHLGPCWSLECLYAEGCKGKILCLQQGILMFDACKGSNFKLNLEWVYHYIIFNRAKNGRVSSLFFGMKRKAYYISYLNIE